MTRLLSLLPLVGACAAVTVTMPVTRPATVNVAKYKTVGVGRLTGDTNDAVGGLLKQALVDTSRFTVLDRENADKVAAELKLAASNAADNSTGPQLGKTLTASVLIIGGVNEGRVDKVDHYSTQAPNLIGQIVTHTVFVRHARAVVRLNLSVTDVETGQLVKAMQVEDAQEDTIRAFDNQPAPAQWDKLFETARQHVVQQFVTAITPHQIQVKLTFLKDGKLPQLEEVIAYAQAGQLDDAEKTVSEAIDLAEKGGLPADVIGKAYWDRGLIYEFSSRFDQARADVKKAYEYSKNAEMLGELRHIDRRQKDEQKLVDQTGSASGEAPAEAAKTDGAAQ